MFVVFQKEILLLPYPRGYHIITDIIENKIQEMQSVQTGMLQVFLKHTSASLTINENADPTVRQDFESHFNKMIPENASHYQHTFEGPDDMPAHLKNAVLGSGILIPITKGKLNLGTWQGVYLCEHRDRAKGRKLVLTAWGE